MSDDAAMRPNHDIAPKKDRGMGIKGRLILSIGAVAMATFIAGGFGIWSYERIRTAFMDVADHSIPVMVGAFELVDRSSSLTASAAALAAAETTERQLSSPPSNPIRTAAASAMA
jgi:hypothetical protein